MRYRSALLLVEGSSHGGGQALSTLRCVVPSLQRVVVLVRTPRPTLSWLTGAVTPDSSANLETLRAQASAAAPNVEVHAVPDFSGPALRELAAAHAVELLVIGERTLQTITAVALLRRRLGLAVLYVGSNPCAEPMSRLTCFAETHRARVAFRDFLRDHVDASTHVTILRPMSQRAPELRLMLDAAGLAAHVEESAAGARSVRDAIDLGPFDQPLVVARLPSPLLLSGPWPRPVLLLPPSPLALKLAERGIDVADPFDDGGPLRLRLDSVSPVGDLPPIDDQPLGFVAQGKWVGSVESRDGEVILEPGLRATTLGVFRSGQGEPADPVAAIEQWVTVVRTSDGGQRPVIVYDASVADEVLRVLSQLTGPPVPELLAVRMRPNLSCGSIRARQRALGLAPRVLDARAVLDEGSALDVSAMTDPVRLARVATRLREAGMVVTTLLHRGLQHPETRGFSTLSEGELLAGISVKNDSPPTPTGIAPLLFGNRIELEIDNAQARHWLLEAIEHSRESVHFQVYMALDDDVGAPVEAALAKAAARGVSVRVLIDSLHGLHGSFGVSNPLLTRLAARPGVELRVVRAIAEIPSLTDLKQRDHRKLAIIDGTLALVGGRNLSHEYYTRFDEVPLTPRSTWREVPWLDAGAKVEGPAVGALASAFLEAWVGAGGQGFSVATPRVVGSSAVRVIIHRGLRDAHTLETYRHLIDTASVQITVVNGFPLVLELQHALVQAVGRGVRVRVLTGHATPTYGDKAFDGPWSTARMAATELVQSRLDPIVAAGGEVAFLTIADQPGWAPELGVVQPHVHAKLMIVDGARCAIGSANLDITASYWESELMLLVEDPLLVRRYEQQIEVHLAQAQRVRADDPLWRQRAQRRLWLRHWPGVLSV